MKSQSKYFLENKIIEINKSIYIKKINNSNRKSMKHYKQ